MTNIYEYLHNNFGIDISEQDYQFKRDYIINPLKSLSNSKMIETPELTDIQYMYNDLQMTQKQIGDVMNCSTFVVSKWLKQNNIIKNNIQRIYDGTIYDYLNNELHIQVKDYIFKRDYIINPLKKIHSQSPTGYTFESPDKDDIEYLYKTIPVKEILKIFQCSNGMFFKWLKKYNIKNEVNKVTFKGNIYQYLEQQFNINCAFQFKRDYIVNPLLLTHNYRLTEKPFKEDLEYLYIDLNLSYNDLSKLFGTKRHMIYLWNKEYGIKKGAKASKDNMKRTNLLKYGVDNYVKTLEYQRKSAQTKRDNHSYYISKDENYCLQKLLSKYPLTKHQYRSEQYPFNCDFYIPEIDTYIEYNGYWTHGKEPFNPNNETHINKIKLWESKINEINFKNEIKKQYKKAITNWTITDPNKRQIAKQNGLNYLEFFNLQEFNQWFNNGVNK